MVCRRSGRSARNMRILPPEFGGLTLPKHPGHLRMLAWMGASAVALGLGAAAVALPAVASADSARSAGSEAASATAGQSGTVEIPYPVRSRRGVGRALNTAGRGWSGTKRSGQEAGQR